MTTPSVLVILPTLGDRLETLKLTLESIDAQRADVDVTLALVAPTRASDARALAATHGALIVDDPGTGISEAINAGLRARSGETYYAWMGDDDLFRQGALKTLSAMLEARPDCVLAYGACDYIDPEARVVAVSKPGKMARWLLPGGPGLIPHAGIMVRLDALEAIGGFDQSLKYAMDLDAFLTLRSHGAFASTGTVVSAFRWHPDSLTVANRNASSREAMSVKVKHLPAPLRPVSVIWNYPVAWASSVAAKLLNRRARALAAAGANSH